MKIPEDFIKHIEGSCSVSETEGTLTCNKCGSKVVVDWFEKTLECLGCDDL